MNLFGERTTTNDATTTSRASKDSLAAQRRALAILDAWLADTDPHTGTIRPGDPGYWPPPVRIADALPPRPERITSSASSSTNARRTTPRNHAQRA